MKLKTLRNKFSEMLFKKRQQIPKEIILRAEVQTIQLERKNRKYIETSNDLNHEKDHADYGNQVRQKLGKIRQVAHIDTNNIITYIA